MNSHKLLWQSLKVPTFKVFLEHFVPLQCPCYGAFKACACILATCSERKPSSERLWPLKHLLVPFRVLPVLTPTPLHQNQHHQFFFLFCFFSPSTFLCKHGGRKAWEAWLQSGPSEGGREVGRVGVEGLCCEINRTKTFPTAMAGSTAGQRRAN